MSKQPFKFENNFDKMKEKIQEKPTQALQTIGSNLIKDIRPTLPNYYKSRKGVFKSNGKLIKGGRLTRSLGFWVLRKEKTLFIGFKAFYSRFVMNRNKEPLLIAVERNREMINQLILDSLKGVSKK